MVRLVLTCFPVVYQSEGVDAKKAHGVAASPEVVSAMTKTNSEEDLAVREKVYERHRMEIQHNFRYLS